MSIEAPDPAVVAVNVRSALDEDIGSGDITARLVDGSAKSTAIIVCREAAILCGKPWVDEVIRQVDASIKVDWELDDGDRVAPDTPLCRLHGNSRGLLSAERTSLNFMQFLSGIATKCGEYADIVRDTGVKLLDTRKTIPGLRLAQKYAVRCGDCHNHRLGLYDAFLIKENHIAACGSIAKAIRAARQQNPDKKIEVEVESLAELRQSLKAGADCMLLDNFDTDTLREAVKITDGKAKLEASGGISRETLRKVAETGIDYISLGTLTKDCKAIDLSMRFEA